MRCIMCVEKHVFMFIGYIDAHKIILIKAFTIDYVEAMICKLYVRHMFI